MSIILENSSIKITKYKDVYTIYNTTGFSPVYIKIKELNCGASVRNITSFEIQKDSNRELNIRYEGTFGIYLDYNDTPVVTIDHYLNTLNNIISYTRDVICGCNCSSCNECDGEDLSCLGANRLFALDYSYYMLNIDNLQSMFNTVAKKFDCLIKQDLFCAINKKNFSPSSDTTFFTKRLFAYYYIIFYFYEILHAEDEEESNYIKNKYEYKYILPCINKLGINVDDLMNENLSGMIVYYWQYNDISSDINTLINNWSSTYLSNLPNVYSKNIESFEDGVTIPYTTVGRIGFVISNTILSNFSIVDALGNDVTNAFDKVEYNRDNKIAFVSKEIYTNSNIFFKFKKNNYASK